MSRNIAKKHPELDLITSPVRAAEILIFPSPQYANRKPEEKLDGDDFENFLGHYGDGIPSDFA